MWPVNIKWIVGKIVSILGRFKIILQYRGLIGEKGINDTSDRGAAGNIIGM